MTETEFERVVQKNLGRMTRVCRGWLLRYGLADSAEDCVSRALQEFVTPVDMPRYLCLNETTFQSHLSAGVKARAQDAIRAVYGITGRNSNHRPSLGLMSTLREFQALGTARTHESGELGFAVDAALNKLTPVQRAIAKAAWMDEITELGDRWASMAERLGMSRRTLFRELDGIRAHLERCLTPFIPRQKDSDTTRDSVKESERISPVSPDLALTTGDTAQGIRDRIKLWRAGRQRS